MRTRFSYYSINVIDAHYYEANIFDSCCAPSSSNNCLVELFEILKSSIGPFHGIDFRL